MHGVIKLLFWTGRCIAITRQYFRVQHVFHKIIMCSEHWVSLSFCFVNMVKLAKIHIVCNRAVIDIKAQIMCSKVNAEYMNIFNFCEIND